MIVNQIIINMHKVLYHFQAVASACINYCRLNCSRDREKKSPELSKLGRWWLLGRTKYKISRVRNCINKGVIHASFYLFYFFKRVITFGTIGHISVVEMNTGDVFSWGYEEPRVLAPSSWILTTALANLAVSVYAALASTGALPSLRESCSAIKNLFLTVSNRKDLFQSLASSFQIGPPNPPAWSILS